MNHCTLIPTCTFIQPSKGMPLVSLSEQVGHYLKSSNRSLRYLHSSSHTGKDCLPVRDQFSTIRGSKHPSDGQTDVCRQDDLASRFHPSSSSTRDKL
jgi:hypothetical protein